MSVTSPRDAGTASFRTPSKSPQNPNVIFVRNFHVVRGNIEHSWSCQGSRCQPPASHRFVCLVRVISPSVTEVCSQHVMLLRQCAAWLLAVTLNALQYQQATALLKNTSQPEHRTARPKAVALLLFVFCVCSGNCRPLLRTVFYGRRSVPHGGRAQLCAVQIMTDKAGLRRSANIKRCDTVSEDGCFRWKVVGDRSGRKYGMRG